MSAPIPITSKPQNTFPIEKIIVPIINGEKPEFIHAEVWKIIITLNGGIEPTHILCERIDGKYQVSSLELD